MTDPLPHPDPPRCGIRITGTTELGVWGNGSHKPGNLEAGMPISGDANPTPQSVLP